MGQTLTHGIYLPDEGERNCYNGLAANWQILDTSVGTIAEHTTALVGKAPLVHTHGKADITDLFNSANTWTGKNTYEATINFQSSYTLGNPPQSAAAQVALKVLDTAGTNYLAQISTYQDTIATGLRFTARDKFDSNGFSPSGSNRNKHLYFVQNISNQGYLKWDGYVDNSLSPLVNNSYDLGSSSYQWNNVYAKNYYYNGVAWGLDKANTWTGINTFSGATNCIITFKFGTAGSYNDIRWLDNNNSTYAALRCKTNSLVLGLQYSSVSAWYDGSSISINNNGSVSIKSYDGTDAQYTYFKNNAVYPSVSSVVDLGTSDNKWKTLNGINPGALSLPDINDSYDVITTNWSTSYSMPNDLKINGANPSYPGWLFIRLDNCTAENDFLIVRYNSTNQANLTFLGTFIPTSSSYVLCVPIQAGITIKVWVSKLPTYCKYYACLGTVK